MSRVRPHDTAPSFEPGDRVAVLASRWNDDVIARLLDGCRDRLDTLGATIEVFRVPGAFELPTAAKWAAEDGRFEAVICLGCVIRGETPHFDYVAGEAARGIARVGLDTGVPCIFGVLTVESHHQALDRVGGEHGHAGVAAAEAAAEMVALRRTIAAA